MTVTKIVCPIDFSDSSKVAATKASELALALNAQVDLVHVYEVPVLALPEGPMTVSPEFMSVLSTRAQEQLEAQRALMTARGLTVETHLLQGSPARSIVDHAQTAGATMIVMGTHGHRGLKHMVLGSVAERVVRSAPMPVLTVRVPDAT